jgi:hypothetical protein
MPRSQAPAAVPTAVHVIDPTGVYSVEDCIRIFRLRKSTIRRELREGRLRVSKRAGRYFLLGEWLLEWLRGGELVRRGAGTNGKNHAENGA